MSDIVYEEDVEQLVSKIVSLIGPQGKYVESAKTALLSVTIESKKYGRLWYGDLDINDADKLTEIVKLAGPITIVDVMGTPRDWEA